MFVTSIVVFIFVLVILVNFLVKKNDFWKCLENIPQPPYYPIIGNLLDIMQTPDKLFESERIHALEYYPIYKLDVMKMASVNLIYPDDIEQVLGDMKHITKSPLYDVLHNWLNTGLLTSTGAKWQTRRKILTPAFHFNILQEFIDIFVKETNNLVEDLEKESDKPFIDVLKPITQFTLSSISETAMGIKLDTTKNDKNSYKDAIYQIGKLLTYRAQRPWLCNDFVYSVTESSRKENFLVKVLHNFSDNVITERKKAFTTSYSTRKRLAMLDLLLKYKLEGADIDEKGIREEVDTFMFEGHDTTSIAISLSLMILANHKNIQDEIRKEVNEILGNDCPTYCNLQELKFMERCIKEILRLYPSVPFISRIAGKKIETKTGYTIPKGCMVNVPIFDVHHSPHLYPDPEKFDPDRFLPENIQKRHPFSYIPFSAGPRNCIGQKFALLEIKTVLAGILKKFILEPIDTPEDIVFVADLVLRTKDSINIKFVPKIA